jgi:hypothetical protein
LSGRPTHLIAQLKIRISTNLQCQKFQISNL